MDPKRLKLVLFALAFVFLLLQNVILLKQRKDAHQERDDLVAEIHRLEEPLRSNKP